MRTTILLAPLLLALAAHAQESARDVSALLAPIRAKHDLPALAGAIVTSAKLEAQGCDGVRRRGGSDKVTLDDRWHLGSCTKAMTATLAAISIEKGELAWDSKPIEVLGLKEKADKGWNDATLTELITNRSGAPTELSADGLWMRLWSSKGTPTEQRRMLFEGVLGKPPRFVPGERFEYSNAGFSIAGAMSETVAKKSWEDVIRARLFEPLGMKSAGFGAPATKDAPDQPLGHSDKGQPVEIGPGDDNPAAIAPAGRVHCTIADWSKFVALHLEGDRAAHGVEGVKARLLTPESFAKLHAPAAKEPEYAMGWSVTDRPWGGRVLTHNGSNTMWFCVTWLAPEKDFAVLVCTNQGGDAAAKACDEAAFALIQDHLASVKPK